MKQELLQWKLFTMFPFYTFVTTTAELSQPPLAWGRHSTRRPQTEHSSSNIWRDTNPGPRHRSNKYSIYPFLLFVNIREDSRQTGSHKLNV